MEKKINSFKMFRKNFEKTIDRILSEINIELSSRTRNYLIKLGLNILDKIFLEIGKMFDGNFHKVLLENELLLLLNRIGVDMYSAEIDEEAKRISSESDKMEKIIS